MNIIEQLFNSYNAKYLEEAKKKGVNLGLQNIFTPIDKIEKATNFRFADHITSETRSVAVLFNTEFICYFIKELPQNYINNIKFTFFYDCEFDHREAQDCIFFSGKKIKVDFVKIENIKDLDKVMAGKNFDVAFSNPPYNGIDLKILESMFSKNVANSFVWIAPIRWLQDPLAKYKRSTFNKFEKLGICQKIQNVVVIPQRKAEIIFNGGEQRGTRFGYDLGIILINKKCANSKIYFDLIDKKIYNILNKIIGKTKSFKDYCEASKIDGFRVEIPSVNQRLDAKLFFRHSVYENGYYKNGIYWTENTKAKNQFSKKIGDPLPVSIKFKSSIESENFWKSGISTFMHFLNYVMKGDVNVPLNFLPCMIEETNPRTGLKGYESEWTNEDFYQFFGITEEEQKYIEETMSQFK